MSKILDEVIAANKKYASSFGIKKDLALPPARGFAVLTCMDARLDPAKYAGLSEGDAHVIRNAGGRASDDAIRSLVISHKLLGTREWFVIHHTNCGMELFTDDVIGDLLADNLETAHFDGRAWSNPKHGHGASAGQFVKWLKGSSFKRCARRPSHPRASSRRKEYSGLRVHLRCALWQSHRSNRSDRSWPATLDKRPHEAGGEA